MSKYFKPERKHMSKNYKIEFDSELEISNPITTSYRFHSSSDMS
jgi:hypothetical protein